MTDIELLEIRAQRCKNDCIRFIPASPEQVLGVIARTKHCIANDGINDTGIYITDEGGRCPKGWDSYNHLVNYRFVQMGSRVMAFIV